MKKKLLYLILILSVIFSAVGVTSVVNKRTGNKGPVEALGYTTTVMDMPKEGSPEDYSSLDNLAILAGAMTKANFTGVTKGVVNADVAFIKYKQNVYNVRTVIDNRAFQQAISTSSMKSVGIQKYFYLDENKVFTRDPSKLNGDNTIWEDGEPTVYSNNQYKNIYGWFPNTISAYILCKETVVEISELKVDEAGNYYLEVSLDPHQSVTDYMYEVKAYAGASEFPLFDSVDLRFTFDKSWTLKEIQTKEVYDLKIPVIGSLKCTGTLTETFSYDDLNLKDKDYFEKYKNLVPEDGDDLPNKELKPIDYLMYGFGEYISGKVGYFNLSLKINNNPINGIFAFDVANNIYAFRSDRINFTYRDDLVYLDIDGLKLKLSINEFKDLVNVNTLASDKLIDVDAIMDALNESEIVKTDNNIKMTAKLPIMGEILPVVFQFKDLGNEKIQVEGISVDSSLMGISLNVLAKPTNDKINLDLNDSEYQSVNNLNGLIKNIIALVNGKAINVALSLEQNGIKLKADGTISFVDNLKAHFNILANIKGKELNLRVDYLNDKLYIYVSNVILEVDKQDLEGLINISSIGGFDLNTVIDMVFNLPIKEIFEKVIIAQDKLDLVLNLGSISESLGKLDLIIASDDKGIHLNSSFMNLKVDLSKGEAVSAEAPTKPTFSLKALMDYYPAISDLLKDGLLNINLNGSFNYQSLVGSLNGSLMLDINTLKASGKFKLNILNSSLDLDLILVDNAIYVKAGNNFTLEYKLGENKSNKALNLNNILEGLEEKDGRIAAKINLNGIILEVFLSKTENGLGLELGSLDLKGFVIKNANLAITKGEGFTVAKPEKVDLNNEGITNLANIINKVTPLFKSNINVRGSFKGISFNLVVDKNFNLELRLVISGEEVVVNYYYNPTDLMQGNLYISYGNLKLKGTLGEAINLIKSLLAELQVTMPELNIDLNNLISELKVDANKLSLKVLGYGLSLDVTNEIKLGLNINNEVIDLMLENTEAKVALEENTGFSLVNLNKYIKPVAGIINKKLATVTINTNILLGNEALSLIGNLNIDFANTKNLKAHADLVLAIKGKELDIKVVFINNALYVSLGNNLTIKLTVAELKELLQMSALKTSEILESLALENGDLKLGLNINGIKLSLALGVENEELVIALRDFSYNNIKLVNTKVIAKAGASFEVVAPTKIDLGKAEVNNLINIINKVMPLFKDSIGVSLVINDLVNINLVMDKSFNLSGNGIINGNEFSFAYIAKRLYFKLGNVNIEGNIEDALALVDEILIAYNTSLEKITGSLDLNNLISSIAISQDKLDLVIKLNDKNINLGFNSQNGLSFNLGVNNINATGSLAPSSLVPAKIEANKYYDLKYLQEYTAQIREFIANDTFNLGLSGILVMDKMSYEINVTASIDKKLNAYLNGYITNSTSKLLFEGSLNNNLINLVFGNIKLRLTIQELKEILGITNSSSPNINIANILGGLEYVEGKTIITLLDNNSGSSYRFGLMPSEKGINISLDDIATGGISLTNINGSVAANMDKVKVLDLTDALGKAEARMVYESIDKILKIVDGNYLNLKGKTSLDLGETKFDIELDINIQIKPLVVSGSITFITIKGIRHVINIDLLDDMIYVSYGNNGVKLHTSEIDMLAEKVKELFGITSPAETLANINYDLVAILNSIVINTSDNIYISLHAFGVDITLKIDNDLNLTVTNVAVDGMKLENTNLGLTGITEFKPVLELDNYLGYNSIVSLLEMIKGLIDLLGQNQVKLDIIGSAKIKNVDYNISGNIGIINNPDNTTSFGAKLNLVTSEANYNNHFFDIRYIGEMFYIIYKNNEQSPNSLNLMANINELKGLINTISEILSFDFGRIEETINKTQGLTIWKLIDGVDFAKLIKSLEILDNRISITFAKELLGGTNDFALTVTRDANGIKGIEANNLYVAGYNVNASITITDKQATVEMPDNLSDFYDLSSLNPLIRAIFNTAKMQDFYLKTVVNINATIIGIPITMNLPIEVKVKLIDGSKYPIVEAKIGPIPVITGVNNDVPYKFGDTVSAGSPGMDRILNIYYKDNKVYFHRTEVIPVFGSGSGRIYEKKLMVTEKTFMANPLYYVLQFGFGFSQSIMDAITGSTGSSGEAPLLDYTNILKGYSYDETNNKYTLSINLAELMHNNKMGIFKVDVFTKFENTKEYAYKVALSVNMPLASAVNITIGTNSLELYEIGKPVDLTKLEEYIKNYTYEPDLFYEYDGSWHLATPEVTLMFEENGGSQVADIKALPSTAITLPEYPKYNLINDKYYYFAGWYTDAALTKPFAVDKETNSYLMPTNGGMLYAKWELVPVYSINIIDPLYGNRVINVLEGKYITLEDITGIIKHENRSYEFKGYFLDSNYTNRFVNGSLASKNMDIYMNYEEIRPVNVSIYDGSGNLNQVIEYTHGSSYDINKLPTNLPTFFNNREHRFLGYSLAKDGKLLDSSYTFTSDVIIYAVFEDKYLVSYDDMQVTKKEEWVAKNGKFLIPALPESKDKLYNTSLNVYTMNSLYYIFDSFSNGSLNSEEITITSDLTIKANYTEVYRIDIRGLVKHLQGKGSYVSEEVNEVVYVKKGLLDISNLNGKKCYTDYKYQANWFGYGTLTFNGVTSVDINKSMKVFYDTGISKVF